MLRWLSCVVSSPACFLACCDSLCRSILIVVYAKDNVFGNVTTAAIPSFYLFFLFSSSFSVLTNVSYGIYLVFFHTLGLSLNTRASPESVGFTSYDPPHHVDDWWRLYINRIIIWRKLLKVASEFGLKCDEKSLIYHNWSYYWSEVQSSLTSTFKQTNKKW